MKFQQVQKFKPDVRKLIRPSFWTSRVQKLRRMLKKLGRMFKYLSPWHVPNLLNIRPEHWQWISPTSCHPWWRSLTRPPTHSVKSGGETRLSSPRPAQHCWVSGHTKLRWCQKRAKIHASMFQTHTHTQQTGACHNTKVDSNMSQTHKVGACHNL